jgi:hypothetical protein
MPTEYKKSRIPYKFAYDDYDNFLRGIELFADDHSGDADFYPNYALIPPLIVDYHTKFSAYVNAQNQEDEARDAYLDNSIKPLRDSLVGLRRLLPALFDDDSMLADFGLNVDVETDVDKLIIQAEICRDHWAELCVPAVPPEYLPVQGKLDAVAGLLVAVEDNREAYAEATRDREIAQNALLISREAINHEERRLFNWYRGLYTNPEDEWWTETPWGKSSGGSGGGGGEEPQPGSWEDAPTNFVVREGVAGSALLTADIHRDADGCAVFMAETDLGVAEPPMRPGEPIVPLIPPLDPGKFSYNLNIPANRRVWFWICHVKNGAWGAMAGPKWIEVIK